MSKSITHHEEFYRGENYVERLNQTRGLICGVGALGSNLGETLVRQGWHNFTILDMDRVESHNIGTQIYEEDDVGQLKVAACQNKFMRIDSEHEIETCNKELDAKNAKKLLKGYDLIIDAFDNRASRMVLQDYARKNNVPCLHSGLHADYGEVVWDEKYTVPQDAEGDVCDYPLARNLIAIIVAIAAEEVLDFCLSDNPRLKDYAFTLKDLRIGAYN